MNGVQAETHSFFEGKPVCTLPEALRSGEDVNIRFKAVQKYLFLASAASEKNGTDRLMTRDFYDLMPQLKLSDFDYIIFDMPPIDALSPTLSMAGFMDKMLVIAEARSTDRDVLKRSYSELVESNANASFVLNKLEPTTGLSFLSDA
jgi:Mrp family chromosome partitioning ATPase